MGKNWLIRTKSNHILGPVSKEKVVELYQNGSIKPDDEICSGNGYWFFIRESDLIERFLLGREVQSFNPISEAKDVLTSSESIPEKEVTRDDITLIGQFDLKQVHDEIIPQDKKKKEIEKPRLEELELKNEEVKKKKTKQRKNVIQIAPVTNKSNQKFLQYLGVLVFLVLFLIIYFRKNIMKSFFEMDTSLPHEGISLISFAQADDEILPPKKKLLESELSIDGLIFTPQIDLEGFKVVSSFELDKFVCEKLDSPLFQLAIILYPTEFVNEKFLIRVRDCVIKLEEKHPVKKWLTAKSFVFKSNTTDLEKINFLTEMLNSPFNLITDQKVKARVIEAIGTIAGQTKLERLLKSYLYLMIGNITHSDNILRSIITESPRMFYQFGNDDPSIYHQLAKNHLEKMLQKFSRHPADRLTFHLFLLYIKTYLNNDELIEIVDDIDLDEINSKLNLSYIQRIAPELVGMVKITSMDLKMRIAELRSQSYSLEMQSYWIWPFVEIGPLISDKTVERVLELDESDPLWAIFILENEKLADLYLKRGGKAFSQRRSFLRKKLEDRKDFMMSLYKLIEIGDIDYSLVKIVSHHLIHD
jgi:hypothetical protein